MPQPPAIARPPPALARALFVLLLLAPFAHGDYRLGEGMALPWGVTAGGYASARLDDPAHGTGTFSVQDLSLFLHGDIGTTWHYFSEFEVGDALAITRDHVSAETRDFDVERLYVEHNLGARDTVRVGKFLTPIGHWNQVHADPLVWSVTRPLTTAAAFARHASGVEVLGTRALARGAIDYQFFADATEPLDASEGHEDAFEDVDVHPNPSTSFTRAGGAYLRYRSEDDSLQIGVSLARFGLKNAAATRDLAGIDLLYARGGWELAGEAIYRRNENGPARADRGGFVQAVAPLTARLFLVATHEHYRSALFPQATDWSAAGLTWRPRQPLSFKLEYRDSSGATQLVPRGLLLSFAILL